jgi:hypothetical protein
MSLFQQLIGEELRFWFKDALILENYRPDWLGGMELDFYLPDFKLAIEVQGNQHYLWCPAMQQDVDDFKAQRRRDSYKRKLARQQGITIICQKSFVGLQNKLRHCVKDKAFPNVPPELRKRMDAYRRLVHKKRNTEWPAFKVKGNGDVIPTNRVAAQYAKAQAKTNKQTSTPSHNES